MVVEYAANRHRIDIVNHHGDCVYRHVYNDDPIIVRAIAWKMMSIYGVNTCYLYYPDCDEPDILKKGK